MSKADQVVLITGATDGLGRATANELAAAGATVLVHGRSDERGAETVAEIRARAGHDRVRFYRADFSSLDEVRTLAQQVLAAEPRLDVLVNNAGVIADEREVTRDGNELTFQVNYLAPFLLTSLLLPRLVESAPARIVSVSSAGQSPVEFDDVMLERGYDPLRAYTQSKLAQILFTVDLAEATAGSGVTVNCVHPGTFMPTKMAAGRFPPKDSVDDGMRSVVNLVTSPELEGVSGRYFNMQQEARANEQAYDEQARARLKVLSERLTA
jgi:NAD(P)-dependent dehydrogenase (short-subunit alcohol dehydrogenase family)